MLTNRRLRVLFYQQRQPLLEIAANLETLYFKQGNHPLFVVQFIEEFLSTHHHIKSLTVESGYWSSSDLVDVNNFTGVEGSRVAHDEINNYDLWVWRIE